MEFPIRRALPPGRGTAGHRMGRSQDKGWKQRYNIDHWLHYGLRGGGGHTGKVSNRVDVQ